MKVRYLGISCITLTLSACGGGEDGGAPGITYSGVTSQASLTIDNGEEIADSSLQNGSSSQSLGTVLSSLNETELGSRSNGPATASMLTVLAGAVDKIQLSDPETSYSRAVQQDSDSFGGECGGSAAYTIAVDDTSGDFNGSFTFSNYCELGDVVNGGVGVSGNINVNDLTFNAFTMSMTSLTVTTGDDSSTMSGSMSLDINSNPIIATMNLRLRDNVTQEVFRVENFDLTIRDTSSYQELGMEGRFYHPEYGYVDVTTPTPFRYSGSDESPYPGVMVARGTNGSTGILTSLSNTSYQIDIDEDGDGNMEQTTTGNWSGL